MTAEPPWPVVVRLAEVRGGPHALSLSADEAARRRIAAALDLDALNRLEAEVELAPWLDGVDLHARWTAAVVRTCGVTLDLFDTDLQGEFHVRAVPLGSRAAPSRGGDLELDPEADDPPDIVEGDAVDVGSYLVEHMALELDPFPRKPGAEFEPPAAETPPSPFASLAEWKIMPRS